jgi:hypothetical protein
MCVRGSAPTFFKRYRQFAATKSKCSQNWQVLLTTV